MGITKERTELIITETTARLQESTKRTTEIKERGKGYIIRMFMKVPPLEKISSIKVMLSSNRATKMLHQKKPRRVLIEIKNKVKVKAAVVVMAARNASTT